VSMGSVRHTPIAEFNNQEPLFSLAFQSLFQNGVGDFVSPRMRKVSFPSYVKFLMCYKDG
ncbi:hypothetical protein EJ02DRAFT_302251, partial [Clathrospora elynae]